jgi:hypothetical protein
MSLETRRPSNDSAILQTAERVPLPSLRLVACMVGLLALAPLTSLALELGEATIKSRLGQALLVEIPYRLAADERLMPACVGLAAPRGDGALPTYSRATRIAITPTHIEIFGESRVFEPLLGLAVDVHCESAPHLVRSYQLFVDPPARAPAILSDGTQFAAARETAASDIPSTLTATTRRANVSARARGQTGGTLEQGRPYVVVRGDTLSGIAARVGDRQATIRETAEAIFAANLGAFTRGDRDLIEAGRSITIPVMTAATAAPPPAAATLAAIVEEPTAATPSPSAESSPASTGETPPLRAEAPASVAAPQPIEPPTAASTVVQPSAAPLSIPSDAPADSANSAAPGRASVWLTALLVLGIVIASSAPLFWVRRRKPEAPVQGGAKVRSSPPRQLVDPVAGFEVVEGRLADAPTASSEKRALPNREQAPPVDARRAAPGPALGIGPVDSVDLDVGTPGIADERIDWFQDRAAAAATATVAGSDATIEHAATARIPDLDGAANARQQPLPPTGEVSDATIDDRQHTLTIVDIDILRQDYEAEHTLTQAGSQELRDAVAELKATQAARASSADTATLEMPQPTQRLRSSR